MPLSDFIYVAISDLESLMGDLVTSRRFSERSTPISLASAERAIVRGSVHTLNAIQPLKIPSTTSLENMDDYDALLLVETIKEAQTYSSAVAALDTIASVADPTAGGDLQNTQQARRASRKAEYEKRYAQFLLGLKTQLHDFKPFASDIPARFRVGQDFGSVPRDYRNYEPFVTIGGGPEFQGNPGRGPSFFSRN